MPWCNRQRRRRGRFADIALHPWQRKSLTEQHLLPLVAVEDEPQEAAVLFAPTA